MSMFYILFFVIFFVFPSDLKKVAFSDLGFIGESSLVCCLNIYDRLFISDEATGDLIAEVDNVLEFKMYSIFLSILYKNKNFEVKSIKNLKGSLLSWFNVKSFKLEPYSDNQALKTGDVVLEEGAYKVKLKIKSTS